MPELDFSNATGVRFGNRDVSAVRIADVLLWESTVTPAEPFNYFTNFPAGLDGWGRISGNATVTWDGADVAVQLNTGTGTTVIGITLTGFNVGKTYALTGVMMRSSTSASGLSIGADSTFGAAVVPTGSLAPTTMTHTFTATSPTHTVMARGTFAGSGTRRWFLRSFEVTEQPMSSFVYPIA